MAGAAAAAAAARRPRYLLFRSDFDVPRLFLHACARTDHSVSEIIEFKSAAGSISFRSAVSQSCSIHACVGGHRRAAAAPRLLRWRCRRLAAACSVRLVGDIRHAEAVFHKVFGQEQAWRASHKQPRSTRHQREAPKSRLGGAREARKTGGGNIKNTGLAQSFLCV